MLFFSFPDTFLFPMFTSHFLESRDENFSPYISFCSASGFPCLLFFIPWSILEKYSTDKKYIEEYYLLGYNAA
jgi:hypothetical protein